MVKQVYNLLVKVLEKQTLGVNSTVPETLETEVVLSNRAIVVSYRSAVLKKTFSDFIR